MRNNCAKKIAEKDFRKKSKRKAVSLITKDEFMIGFMNESFQVAIQ